MLYIAEKNKLFKKELQRKALHLSSLWMPLFIYVTPQKVAMAVFLLLLAGDVVLEYANFKKYGWARQIFGVFFARIRRPHETAHTRFEASGSMYVLATAAACTAFFSRPIAITSLSVMLVSDASAALFGRAYGSYKIYRDKSLQGTMAFLASGIFTMWLLSPLLPFGITGIIAVLIAAAAELYEDKIKIDDNFLLPLLMGGILSLSAP